MAPLTGCVVRRTANFDALTYNLEIVTPDQTTLTVWSETDIAIGHYFCGVSNGYGRYQALSIPAEEEQHIALTHRAFTQACQRLLALNEDLKQSRIDCERQINVCRKRKEGAGNQAAASAVGGGGITLAGIATLNPLMIGAGLIALSRVSSANAEISAQSAEEQRLRDLLARKEQQLPSARQAVNAAAAAYAAAFDIPTQRLKLLRSYSAR